MIKINNKIQIWVIDTSIWMIACENQEKASYAMNFIMNVYTKHKMALDYSGEIVKEYEKALKKAEKRRTLCNAQIVDIFRYMPNEIGKIQFCHSGVNRRHKRFLIHNLNFDPDDLKFVGVCHNSPYPDKLITAEDRHYSKEVIKYIREKMDIKFFNIEDTVNVV